MTWTKLSDDFSDECWDLSDGAFRLMVELLNYSNRKLLDGLVPLAEFRRFAKHDQDDLAELVSGSWVELEGQAVRLIFHAQWQPKREVVLRQEETARQNGRKGGRPRKPRPDVTSETQNETDVGYDDDGSETQNETQQLTQNETQRVWSGLDRSFADEGDHLDTRDARANEIADWSTVQVPGEWESPSSPGAILAAKGVGR